MGVCTSTISLCDFGGSGSIRGYSGASLSQGSPKEVEPKQETNPDSFWSWDKLQRAWDHQQECLSDGSVDKLALCLW